MKEDAKNASCHQVRIAHSGMGEVSICPECGVVHVALQYFSMRFELAAFNVMQKMLSEAQDKIEMAQQVQAASAGSEPYAAVNGDSSYKTIVH